MAGVLLALATAASFAASMWRHSPYRINAITALAGAALLAVSCSWQLAAQDWHVGALAWVALLYGAFVSVGLGNLLWFNAIDRAGRGGAVYANLQPFLGALFAVAVLSESLRPLQVVGGLVVGAAILLARSLPGPAPPAE